MTRITMSATVAFKFINKLLMAKFLKRLVGSYEEKNLLMQITLDKLECVTKQAYLRLFIEFKRGDKVERTDSQLQIPVG